MIGEHRFLGLFTSSAYNSNPIDVPAAAPQGRGGRRPRRVPPRESRSEGPDRDPRDLPRDDLFQIGVEALCTRTRWASCGCRNAGRCASSSTAEIYGRFVSCMVFLPARSLHDAGAPADRRRSSPRRSARESHEWNVRLGESVLARLHFVFHVDPRDPSFRRPRRRSKSRSRPRRVPWVDDFRETLDRRTRRGGRRSISCASGATRFPARTATTSTRRRRSPTSRVLADLDESDDLAVRLARAQTTSRRPQALRRRRPAVAVGGAAEPHQHGRRRRGRTPVRRHAARGASALDQALPARACREHAVATGAVGDLFEEAFLAVLDRRRRRRRLQPARPRRRARRGAKCRCCARYSRYLRQIGTLLQPAYIEDALAAHPDIARGLVELFVTRLDPWLERAGRHRPARRPDRSRARRGARRSTRTASCAASCTSCSRRCARTGSSPARTATLARESSLKVDPSHASPTRRCPLPMFEIFVYSPRVEGVHLRGGPGRARRHPLVRPARGLPHRDPRADEGAAREERRDRAGRREGRLRREAAAG